MRNNAVYQKICCVYFLFLRGRLIYIGQTTDLIARMASHDHEHQHDSIRWIVCRREKLEEYEIRLIKILKPLANYAHNACNTSRVKLNYKKPKWLSFYKWIGRYTNALKTGSYRRLDPDTIRWHLKEAKAKFRYYYRTQGYKGTFLDESINHPL